MVRVSNLPDLAVEVVAYSTTWPRQLEKERAALRDTVGSAAGTPPAESRHTLDARQRYVESASPKAEAMGPTQLTGHLVRLAM